jgi:uncharacterized membrane protein
METPREKKRHTEYLIFATLIVFMFSLTIMIWNRVPSDASIPVHWGIDGKPDRFGGKIEGLLLIPLISLLFPFLYWLIPKIDPRKFNVEKSRKAYVVIIIAIMTFMAVVHSIMAASACGRTINVSIIIPAAVGVLFMILGNYMGKIRSNFFLGFRTPWTLSSDLSWNKTHRLAGWIMVVFGLMLALTAIIGNGTATMIVLLSGMLATIAIPTIYSYLKWKSDPCRKH